MKPEPFLYTALLLAIAIFIHGQDDWDTLLVDGFDQGSSAGWNLESGCVVHEDNGNYYLTGTGHSWARRVRALFTGRGFAIHPGNSDIVLAAAGITTGEQGIEFDKTRGKIYKTVDGGENWYPVWEGNNLARVLIYNYLHPYTVFCSTGIFDREAYNSDIANGILGGVGILRSHDGGESWHTANTGIDNLYLGFLEMHPADPGILMRGMLPTIQAEFTSSGSRLNMRT